jgi:MYND finger
MNRYTGCLEAPVYDECISTPMFYCSPVCQKADWGQHKSECRKLQARKTLGRAALLLQAIIYRLWLGILAPTRAKPTHLLAPREGIPLFLQCSVSVRCGAVATEYHATRIHIVVERSIARLACGSTDTAQMRAASQGIWGGCIQLSAVRQISPHSPMPTLSSRTLDLFGH